MTNLKPNHHPTEFCFHVTDLPISSPGHRNLRCVRYFAGDEKSEMPVFPCPSLRLMKREELLGLPDAAGRTERGREVYEFGEQNALLLRLAPCNIHVVF